MDSKNGKERIGLSATVYWRERGREREREKKKKKRQREVVMDVVKNNVKNIHARNDWVGEGEGRT